MSIFVLSEAEALEHKNKALKLIEKGILFDLGIQRYFIALAPVENESLEVIELTKKNIQKITGGEKPTTSTLLVEEMDAINIRRST